MIEKNTDIRKLAIFGGTFDPVHIGHKRILRAAGKLLGLDRAFIIPAKEPPHKEGAKITSGEDRLEMCKTAFAGLPKAVVSDWELTREGKSYSIDTVTGIKGLFPDAKIFFLMGSDMFMSVDSWHRSDELLKLCIPVCMPRAADNVDLLKIQAAKLGKALVIDLKPLDISSTQIRELIAAERWDEAGKYLDSGVLAYIRAHGLYTRS